MKYILLILLLILSGCQSIPSLDTFNTPVDESKLVINNLNNKIIDYKQVIAIDCDTKARSIQRIAIRREEGISKEHAINDIFYYLETREENPDIDIKTHEVLTLVLMTHMIYSEPVISVQGTYNGFYDDCIKTNTEEIDRMYKRFKYQIEHNFKK